jgi:hypothetical protein
VVPRLFAAEHLGEAALFQLKSNQRLIADLLNDPFDFTV